MSTDPASAVERPPRIRCAVTNGTRLFASADGRSANARLLRDLEAELAEPLGGTGALTAQARLRVQSAAALSVRLEAVRSSYARGELNITDEDLIRLSNGLSRELRALERLAAARKAKPKGDELRSYINSHGEAAA